MIKTTQNYQIDQITMNCIHLTSNWQKCRVLSQNIQNNAKLQKWSKYNDLNRFDVELAKMSSFVTKHSKQRKTPKVIKIQWLCIDLMSKWSKQRKTTKWIALHWFDVELAKMSSFVTKHSKQRKTPKVIKIQWLESIWCRIRKNVEFCHKTFKTTQNSKSDQSTMTLHRFDVKMIKTKQRKTTKSIKLRWIALIWRRIGKNVEFCHKTFKTTQNSKSDQNTMTCIDLMLKWSKQRKTTKSIKLRWIACIWRRIGKNVEFCHKTFKTTQNSKSDQNTMTWIDLMSNCQKCRVLSKNIQNNAKLQKWSKYNDLNRFDVEFAKMSSFVTKHSKQRKTTKSIKLRWIACIWRRIGKNVEFCHKTFKTTQNSKSDQNTMTWIDLMSNSQKCRVLSQNIQNNAKLPKRSNYDELHTFDVELAKMSSFVTKHSKQRKTPKVIKIQWLESIWCRIGKNVEFCHKTFKTTQNYQSDQITMNCMHLTSNWQKCRVLSQNIQNNAKLQKWSKYNDLNRFDVEFAKMSSFVTKHSKQRKTPKVIKVQWLCIDLMSKWSKQRKTTKSIKLRWIALIWRRIGKNVEFCHKTFKTTQNSKSDQNTMTCIDLMLKWSKQRKTSIKLRCRCLSQNIQNNAKLQKWSKYNDLNRFDVELAKMSSFVTKNDQNTIFEIWCHWQKNIQNNAKLQKRSKYNDLNRFDVELAKMSSFVTKHSKQRKTPKVIKIQWLASIWCQNDQNNAKLPNRSNYDELHAFDVELAKMSSFVTKHSKQRKTPKVIKIQWLESIWCRIGKNVEFCHKTFKTTQNSKSDQNTMTCIDLMSNWQKCRVLSQNIQNNAKLQKWSKYNDLNRFDVELAKMSSFVTKHSKQRKTPKVIKIQWLCIDLMSKWSKQRKTTKAIKLRWIAWFDVELAKMSSFVTKHSKQRKTPKVIKIQWLASIWC